LEDKLNTARQRNSTLALILGLVSIFSTQLTNDIIGYGELAQKIIFRSMASFPDLNFIFFENDTI